MSKLTDWNRFEQNDKCQRDLTEKSVSHPHGQETLRAMNRTKKRFGCKATKNLPIIVHHFRNHSHTGKKY